MPLRWVGSKMRESPSPGLVVPFSSFLLVWLHRAATDAVAAPEVVARQRRAGRSRLEVPTHGFQAIRLNAEPELVHAGDGALSLRVLRRRNRQVQAEGGCVVLLPVGLAAGLLGRG